MLHDEEYAVDRKLAGAKRERIGNRRTMTDAMCLRDALAQVAFANLIDKDGGDLGIGEVIALRCQIPVEKAAPNMVGMREVVV